MSIFKRADDGYYHIDRIKAADCQYNLLMGERANGKSYAVKKECITDAISGRGEIIYLRRWKLELKEDDVNDYFYDVPITEISGGKYTDIKCSRSRLYALQYNDNGDITEKLCIGRTAALSSAEHLKSTVKRGQYKHIIYEEVNSRGGYLTNEPDNLQQFVATVFGRTEGKVWLIGNTVSRYNPYFQEWQLKSIQNMQPGDIDIYRFSTGQYEDDQEIVIKIAVEYCESTSSVHKGKMFFGNAAENINTGVWETDQQPHLPEPFENYKILYQVFMMYKGMGFEMKVLQHKQRITELLLFINSRDKKPDKIKRVVTDEISGDPLSTTKFVPLTGGDDLVLDLIRRGKIVYSTNLAGTDFKTVLTDNKIW